MGPSSMSSKWNTYRDCPGWLKHMSKLQVSVQLHTVLALHEQENVRNNEPPNCSRLKTSVRRHFDQTMRTPNFRAWNEIVERGAVTKSRKGREIPAWNGKWENAISGKQLDSVRKETHVVSFMIERLVTDAIRNLKDHRLLLHQKRRHRLTERNHVKVQASEWKVLLEKEAELRADISFGRKCTNPSCNYWHPPVSQLQVWIRMHTWRKMLIPTRWGWWTARQKVEEKWWEGSVASPYAWEINSNDFLRLGNYLVDSNLDCCRFGNYF